MDRSSADQRKQKSQLETSIEQPPKEQTLDDQKAKEPARASKNLSVQTKSPLQDQKNKPSSNVKPNKSAEKSKKKESTKPPKTGKNPPKTPKKQSTKNIEINMQESIGRSRPDQNEFNPESGTNQMDDQIQEQPLDQSTINQVKSENQLHKQENIKHEDG